MSGAQLSVVVPTLNEARALPSLLADLLAQQGVMLEILVADGGSTDGTPQIAQRAGARLVQSGRGRGRQMNAAARVAQGDWLLFLHADSSLPSPRLLADAVEALWRETDGGAHVAGHFPLRFARAQPGHELFFRYLEGKTRLNRPHTVNGDQGLLISRAFFEALGGYDESLPIFEDQRLAARIFDTGRFVVLPGELITSARRFEAEGIAPRYTLMALMMGAHAAGLHEFFERAPEVYAAPGAAAALHLRPFVRLLRGLLWSRRWRGLSAAFWRAGRFVRDNAWQLAYLRDVRRGDGELRCLRRFDCRIRPLLTNPFATLLASLLLGVWFYLRLPFKE